MTRYPGRFAGIGERALAPLLLSALPVPSTLGSPITEATGIALRQIVFGQCPTIIRSEYFVRGPGIVFREPDQKLSYGIAFTNSEMTPMARSVLMIIQAHIIRALLFETDPSRVIKTRKHPLEPTKVLQREALCSTIADILWRAGNEQGCILCLPSKTHVYINESMEYNQDGVTERLQLVKFEKMIDLLAALRRYLYIFQEEPGPCVLLLIYSAILSRGLDQIAEDINGRTVNYRGNVTRGHLVNAKGSFSHAVFTLLTTGRATPFFHNGVQYRGDEDTATITETGVLVRSSIGLLTWLGSDEKTEALNIGSRLKTPLYPIWVTIVGDNAGLLFSEDRALLRDYRNEYRFQLHYFTSSHYQPGPVTLTVSTRFSTEDIEPSDLPTQTLQKIVRTKWSGARVNWNIPNPVL